MKKLILAATLATFVAGAQAQALTDKQMSQATAVADSVTTLVALSAGAAEANPVVTPSPLGLLVLAGVKFGLLEIADTLPPDERKTVHRMTRSIWGGVSASNLLVALAAPMPAAVAAGVSTGYILWNWSSSAPAAVSSTGASSGQQEP